MSDTDAYEAFAAAHPPDSAVQVVLKDKELGSFHVTVAGTELKGVVGQSNIALDEDDIELAQKYAEPGEQMRAFVRAVHPDRELVSLTLIDPATDPWRAHAEELHVGAILEAKVLERGIRGYDVELFEGVVTMLPNDEVSWEEGASLAEGATVDVVLTEVGDHSMEVSARRAILRPTKSFSEGLSIDWERGVPPDASFEDEQLFRLKLATDLRSAGIPMDLAFDEDAPPETLIVFKDDVAGGVSLLAIEHGALDDAARKALAGSRSFNELDGPAGLSAPDRAAIARVLAMVGRLRDLRWPIDAWIDDAEEALTEEELEALAGETEVRVLHSDGSKKGRVDGRIVQVMSVTHYAD